MSLFDELITVIQPGEEGNERPLPCEDSSIFLQVINIQTEKEEQKATGKNSPDPTSQMMVLACFLKTNEQKNTYPQLTDSTISMSRGSMD